MKNHNIRKRSEWIHRKSGLIHTVVEEDNNNVITWSRPINDGGGMTWLGPVAAFIMEFTPAPPSKEAINA